MISVILYFSHFYDLSYDLSYDLGLLRNSRLKDVELLCTVKALKNLTLHSCEQATHEFDGFY